MKKNPRLIDLEGQRFGEWSVLHKAGNSPRGAALWLCVCSCGNRGTVSGTDLRQGKSTRCASCRGVASATTHGGSGTRLHRIWKNMRTRCCNPASPNYEQYGARGISVCPEWGEFEVFRAWALENGYRDGLSIERKNNNDGYEPDNCTWADSTTQSVNRRFVKRSPTGKPWFQVAREAGITNAAYRSRLNAGWTHELAATWPMRKRRPGRERQRDSKGRFL